VASRLRGSEIFLFPCLEIFLCAIHATRRRYNSAFKKFDRNRGKTPANENETDGQWRRLHAQGMFLHQGRGQAPAETDELRAGVAGCGDREAESPSRRPALTDDVHERD